MSAYTYPEAVSLVLALEARSRRHDGLHHAILVDHPAPRLGTATAPLGLGQIRPGTARLLHAARRHVRLDVRPPLQPFQAGDLLPLLGDDPTQSRNLTEKFYNQSFQLGRGQRLDVGRIRHAIRESDDPAAA